MTTTTIVTLPVTKQESLLKRVLTNPSGIFSIGIIALVVLFGILGPLFSPYDPAEPDVYSLLATPGPAHWLGTDSAGRDIFTRLAASTNFSLITALLAVVIAIVIGVISGLIAGYFGGWFDSLANWLTSILMALPGLVVLLAAASVLGPSMWTAMGIFGVLLSPAYFRLVYVTVRAVKNELFVDAARVSGLSDLRIISRHILGVVRTPIIIQTAIIGSIAIAIQSGLEFLGLGDTANPSWGSMLNDAFGKIYVSPILLLWPSAMIALITLSLVIFANTLRDELERTGAKQTKVKKGFTKSASQLASDSSASETIYHEAPNRGAGEQILKVSNLAVGYPDGAGGLRQVVHNVNLDINKGEVVGLIGESGSGKTQTAFSILGLLPKGGRIVSGSILFEGQDLVNLPAAKYDGIRGAKISYIPQEPMSNLDPSFTIGTQLTEPIRQVLGLSKKEANEKAIALLTRVGIPNPELTMKKFPHEISGGQAQRVLIAGAVSCDPDLIIADEPTTALDVTVQAEVLDLLRELQKETNTALLLVTHNFGVVADLCDYINVMQFGRIIEAGPVRDIFEKAKHPYTQSLLDSILEGGPARGAYVAPKGN
jgi:ABC-type dipeptide/oligopeptide/nickel transport system ATPase component/ABC-type dipeptide/oligopeptide/nickel transport system permease subunit